MPFYVSVKLFNSVIYVIEIHINSLFYSYYNYILHTRGERWCNYIRAENAAGYSAYISIIINIIIKVSVREFSN